METSLSIEQRIEVLGMAARQCTTASGRVPASNEDRTALIIDTYKKLAQELVVPVSSTTN